MIARLIARFRRWWADHICCEGWEDEETGLFYRGKMYENDK